MEKSEKISELIHLHKEIKEMMAKYDEVFNKTVKFHKIREEVSAVLFIFMNAMISLSHSSTRTFFYWTINILKEAVVRQ